MGVWILALAFLAAASAQQQKYGPTSEYHDILDLDVKEWRLAFRGTARINVPLYPAYLTGEGISTVPESCKSSDWELECNSHYRNNDALDANWEDVKDVLFGVVHNGALVKHVIFNATGSTKTTWFNKERLMVSCYDDIDRMPSNIFSIEGDAGLKRRFMMNMQYGGCSNDAGWMVTLDRTERNCNWEKPPSPQGIHIYKYPVIKYAAGQIHETYSKMTMKEGDALVVFLRYNDHRGEVSEYHDLLNTGRQEYRMVFRGTSDVNVPVYQAYLDGTDIPQNVSENCKSMDLSLECDSHYRNTPAFQRWTRVEEVLMAIVSNSSIVNILRFNGRNSTYLDWFSKERLNTSCYSDLRPEIETNFFSIIGDDEEILQRRFFINHQYGGCTSDAGWMAVLDKPQSARRCNWEKVSDAIPTILYTAGPRVRNYNQGLEVKQADAFIVFVKYQEY